MPGNYNHTTRPDGTVLTDAIYNADHENHVNNSTPDGVDDASADVSAYRAMSDPGETGSENLPTSLRGEIQRLRKLLSEVTGKAQWYESPATNLEAAKSVLDEPRQEYPRAVGANCVNNGTTPRTKFDMAASALVLVDSAGRSVTVRNPGALTNDTGLAGPAENGRDQSLAFPLAAWIHFYWIYDATEDTLSSISSLTAPPDGPALPTGYTYWAYAGAVRSIDGGGFGPDGLIDIRISGSRAYLNAVSLGALDSAGGILDVSGLVPPNAISFGFKGQFQVDASAGGDVSVTLNFTVNGLAVGSEHLTLHGLAGSSFVQTHFGRFTAPNVGQQLSYSVNAAQGAFGVGTNLVRITDYELPNGG